MSQTVPSKWVWGVGAMLGLAALGQTGVAAACAQPPSPENVRVWREAEVTEVGIATDGFVLLDTYSRAASEALELTTVKVTNAAGEEVAGKLELFDHATRLAWVATSPLEVGSELTVVVTGALVPGHAAVPDEVELRVTGEPTTLGAQSLDFGRWLDFAHGVGSTVQCVQSQWAPCGSGLSFLPEAEELLHAVDLSWQAPDWHGYLMWDVSVDQTDEQRQLRSFPLHRLIDAGTKPASDVLGTFAFPSATTDYCVTLVVRDLRTEKIETIQHCAAPQRGDATLRDSDLANCREPPTPALTEAWCGLHPESTLKVCKDLGKPPVNDPQVDEEHLPKPTSNGADESSHTSSGCQLALVGASAAGGSFGGFGAVVGLLSLLSRRRRRD